MNTQPIRAIVNSKLPLVIGGILFCSCSSETNLIYSGDKPRDQWREPYVYLPPTIENDKRQFSGVENLDFDGKGSLYVSGFDGYVYLVKPTESEYSGKIENRILVGEKCFGIAAGEDAWIYVAAEVTDQKNGEVTRKIFKVKKDFSSAPSALSNHIEGLNGIELDRNGNLYFTSSNLNQVTKLFSPNGRILRAQIHNEASFKLPTVVADDLGIVNGLALSKNGSTLYYTETLNGVWAYHLTKKEKESIYSPDGIFPIVDDLTINEKDGTLWIAVNSEAAVVHLKNNTLLAKYRIGDLGAPSSMKFGRGPHYRSDFLYITELAREGRSFTIDGRGIWILPITTIQSD